MSLLTVRLLTAPLLTLPLGQAPPSAFMTGLLGQPGRRAAASGPLRALAVTVAVSNLGLGALFSVFVLFARIRLGAGPLGYGMLLGVMAAGGLAGGLAAGRVTSAIRAATALRADLVVEAFTYAGLLLTRDPVIAAALLAFLAANLAVFSSVSATLRQSLAPPGMLGRVQGAYRAVGNGGLLTGAALGGLLTSAAAPLWLGLAAIATVIALTWRALGAVPDAPHHSGARRALR